MKIGVVSDTHGFFDPRLAELWAGIDLILHAGDVGKPKVLDDLERIAPVRAVRGNVDSRQLGLPLSMTLKVGGTTPTHSTSHASGPQLSAAVQVEILHELPAAQNELEKWASQAGGEQLSPPGRDAFLRAFDHNTRVVIFGHSHVPCAVVLGGKLFFNPGSAGKQRFSLPRSCGVLEVSTAQVKATILSLQQYNKKLPEKVVLQFG